MRRITVSISPIPPAAIWSDVARAACSYSSVSGKTPARVFTEQFLFRVAQHLREVRIHGPKDMLLDDADAHRGSRERRREFLVAGAKLALQVLGVGDVGDGGQAAWLALLVEVRAAVEADLARGPIAIGP